MSQNTTMHLILIETSGNQNYIFSTNKLRENIGASELTYRAGTQWVLEAVKAEGGPELWNEKNRLLRQNLLNKDLSKPIENDGGKVEIIVATSGKALLLVKELETGKNIIRNVTKRALKEAPGLDICGAIEKFNFEKDNLAEINRKIHQNFEKERSKKPSPLKRFLRLPVVDECKSSGLSASTVVKVDGDPVPISSVSLVKRNGKLTKDASERVDAILKSKPEQLPLKLPYNLKDLDGKFEELEWSSVIHADGNGLGEIILKFDRQITGENPAAKNRDYIQKLRRFSLALDICTENAFYAALKTTFADKQAENKDQKDVTVPLVPLVLGGDDLTVVCDGKYALNFTYNFLLAFEEETAKNHLDNIIPEVAKEALGTSRLSACGGVAIVKPHFPFYNAYELSEQLMKSAKTIKKKLQREPPKPPQESSDREKLQKQSAKTPWPSSALDFHILYDSSSSELDLIRKKLRLDVSDESYTKIYSKPYVITPLEWLEKEASNLTDSQVSFNWAKDHHWQELIKRVSAFSAVDEDGKRKLSRTQMYDLRSGLFLGKEKADARLKLIWHRYRKLGLDEVVVCPDEPSLFWWETEEKKIVWLTNFLDAIDAVDFLARG